MKHDASPLASDRGVRRTRLVELGPHIHCSVIGTCLGSADLRDIVARFAGFEFQRASGVELHHAAVQIAAEGGRGAEALHQVLDTLYAAAIRRFDQARNETELSQLWSAMRRSGETAGAYWALMTHPRATRELRQRILGEAHGLIYLVTGPAPALAGD